jgi:acid phosphatase family membrane protein YuiD
MDRMDIVNQYRLAAEEFALQYGVSNEHIISIISSVMMTRDGRGISGGGFVQSVIANDLFGAISRADNECYNHLKVIVAANQYAYLD